MTSRFRPVLTGFSLVFCAVSPVLAEQVTVTGDSAYVTKADCAALVRHNPSAGVAYQQGVDSHGKYVAPADLPGNDMGNLVPDKIRFNIQINPMNYVQSNAARQQVAGTSNAITQNYAAQQKAQAAQPQLAAKVTALQTTQTQLAARKAQIDSSVTTQTAQIIAQTGGQTPSAAQTTQRILLMGQLQQSTTGTDSYRQILADQATNAQALAAANAAVTNNQQGLTAATAAAPQLQNQLTGAQGQLAASQGAFGNTAMPVAQVEVDMKTGQTMINGHPLGSQQDQIVAEACRKAGIR